MTNYVNHNSYKRKITESFLFSVINGKIGHPVIAQYTTGFKEKCGLEICKWSTNVLVPEYTELKYLQQSKFVNKENHEDQFEEDQFEEEQWEEDESGEDESEEDQVEEDESG